MKKGTSKVNRGLEFVKNLNMIFGGTTQLREVYYQIKGTIHFKTVNNLCNRYGSTTPLWEVLEIMELEEQSKLKQYETNMNRLITFWNCAFNNEMSLEDHKKFVLECRACNIPVIDVLNRLEDVENYNYN